MQEHGFLIRFLIIFLPLIVFMVLIRLAGIDNLFMIIILSLAFVWMIQAIYKKIMAKKQQEKEND